MDRRTELVQGTLLCFPGLECRIGRCIGRGSNAIVYEATYPDASAPQLRHQVLIKELFPYEPGGHIWRDETGQLCTDAQGEETWRLHRLSFEKGNEIHLQLLSAVPEQIGGNLNTFALNHTLYTLLDYSGGRSLDRALSSGPIQDLLPVIRRMRGLLWALDAFHRQGLLHLDISLDNVLLVGSQSQERVLLIDYNSVHTHQELLEQKNTFFSVKEGFAAPEVQTGMTEAIGTATDLFSAACIFYALLTGAPPTSFQLSRRNLPDISRCPALMHVAPAVKAQAGRILRRGLCPLPDRRYASCREMLDDLEELQNRLEGVGVTHAALWEAGKRSVQRLVQQNPSLAYVQREVECYPLHVHREDGLSLPAEQLLQSVAEGGPSVLLLGEGGAGKSTVLLRAALESDYSPIRPAVLYLPLMGWQKSEDPWILDRILMELHFDAKTRTMEDARHALTALLQTEQKQPVLLLLLDGLNEAMGDHSALVQELGRLSALPGLRMVIASRSTPQELSLSRACLTPLEDQDVAAALERHGLLLPESASMQRLLHTPMMLSLFIQTAESTLQQVLCQTEQELLGAYLDALCAKAARNAGQAADYQVEAAVRLVLPAIARQAIRSKGPLTEAELYRTVRRFHSALENKRLLQAFPQWLGHSREILGASNGGPEVWYGVIVQEILWRRLGLLVQDENGCFRIRHQIMQEHLALQDKDNQRRLHSRRMKIGLFATAAFLLLAGLLLGSYELWLKPKPHHQTQCCLVINAAVSQYVNYGLEYDAMLNVLGGQYSPEDCMAYLNILGESPSRSTALALEGMKQEGEVVPWSGLPFAFNQAEKLLVLSVESKQDYQRYLRAWQLMCEDRTSTSRMELQQALSAVLEADADMAWLLEQAVCLPHIETMDAMQRISYEYAMTSLPSAQENRSINLSRGLDAALEKAAERQKTTRSQLDRLSVMHDPYVLAEEDDLPLWPEITLSSEKSLSADAALEWLLEQLVPLLDTREQLFAAQQETLQAVEAFMQQGSYPALLQARLACDKAGYTLDMLEVPVLSLFDEALLTLMKLGCETDGLESEYAPLAQDIASGRSQIAMFESLLYSAVYQKSQQDTVNSWLAIGQNQLDANLSYESGMLNVLLLPFCHNEVVQTFWSSIPQRWPVLGSGLLPLESDPDRLTEIIRQSLSDYQDAAVEQSYSVLGADSYAIEQFAFAVQMQDQETLYANHMPIADMPQMVPLPDFWLNPAATRMYPDDETEPDGQPGYLIIISEGVSLEDYLAYVGNLSTSRAYPFQQEGSDEEGWRHLFVIDGEPLMFHWEPEGLLAALYDPSALSLEAAAYITSANP